MSLQEHMEEKHKHRAGVCKDEGQEQRDPTQFKGHLEQPGPKRQASIFPRDWGMTVLPKCLGFLFFKTGEKINFQWLKPSALICCCSYSQTNANTRLNIIISSEFKTWVTENRYQGPVSCMYQFWFNTKRILNKMSGAYPKVIFFQDNLDFGGVLAWFHRL